MRSGSDVQVTALVMEIHPPAMLFRGRVLHSAVDIDVPPMPTSIKKERCRARITHVQQIPANRARARYRPRGIPPWLSPPLFLFLASSSFFFSPCSPASQKSGLLSHYKGGTVLKAAPRRPGLTDKSAWYTSIPRWYENDVQEVGRLMLYICEFQRYICRETSFSGKFLNLLNSTWRRVAFFGKCRV